MPIHADDSRSKSRNPFELFNAALEVSGQGETARAVVLLRQGFFENLYIAPLLLDDECDPQDIWYPGADGQPHAAREYVSRYRRPWERQPQAIELLGEVWHDPLVREELRRFINLSKNLLAARGAEFQDILRERERFVSPARLERTQREILARLQKIGSRMPARRPRMPLVMLASRDPASSVEFYRNLLGVEPTATSEEAGGYAEFAFDGVHFAIHGQDGVAQEDPYLLGPAPTSFGWGAIFVFRVTDLDRYYETASALGVQVVDNDLASKGRRYFVVRDPSGYLLEVTEEDPRGLDTAEHLLGPQ